mgnify:CR=1 FL=1|tara:strand:- start:166 stop:447 length:282 start_codon:yes stop_codon:yes gene_type:complete
MNHRRRGLISKMMSYAPEYRGDNREVDILGTKYEYDDARVQAVLSGLQGEEYHETIKAFIQHLLGLETPLGDDFVKQVLNKLNPNPNPTMTDS